MNLFVYGTLRNAVLMQAVAGGEIAAAIDAVCAGYQVTELPDNVVPMIVAQSGAQAVGCIYSGLSDKQISRLDLFEGAFGYARTTVDVATQQDTVAVQMYLPPAQQTDGEKPWSLQAWETAHLQPTLYAIEELFSHDPLPDHDGLRRFWPVIEKRAWAKHRALTAEKKPAEVRYPANSNDWQVTKTSPPKGTFFRLQDFEVSHRQFDGAQSPALPREVFMGVDAALVLPFDPKNDTVLLVEQFRMGPMRRGDANPWTLEPIAGMTDARETAEEAARREAYEEANIKVDKLDHMFSMYPSPGCSTDYFACFCAPADLPKETSYFGGLEEEAEDLRIHIVPLAKALDLIETAEIEAGPLVAMLYWLDRNKKRYH